MLSDRWFVWLSQAALLAALVLLVALGRKHRELGKNLAIVRSQLGVLNAGDAVPILHTLSVAGDSVHVGDAQPGHRQVLFFLTKECPFCRATMPAWRAIADAVRDSGGIVSVVAMGIDSADQLPAYLKSNGITVPVIALTDRRMRKLFRAAAVPQTVVLGEDGAVLYARTGQIVNSQVRDSVISAAFQRNAFTRQ